MSGKVSHKQSMFTPFIELFFTERLVSYLESSIVSNSAKVRETDTCTHSFHNIPTLYSYCTRHSIRKVME